MARATKKNSLFFYFFGSDFLILFLTSTWKIIWYWSTKGMFRFFKSLNVNLFVIWSELLKFLFYWILNDLKFIFLKFFFDVNWNLWFDKIFEFNGFYLYCGIWLGSVTGWTLNSNPGWFLRPEMQGHREFNGYFKEVSRNSIFISKLGKSYIFRIVIVRRGQW